MKVLQINTVFRNGGSTGRIAYDLMQIQKQEGIEAYAAYGYETGAPHTDNTICLQSTLRRKINILRTRLFDHHGFYNEAETRKLIRWMDEIHPDIIHLHNIHNHYVNVKMLFEYIKMHDIPVVWTLHDCWSFTGHCAYFDFADCDKWKLGCHDCPSLKDYPPTWFFDRTRRNYKDKKIVFTGVKNLTLVTPSEWLAHLTRESFLKDYPVEVINNGVDTNVFKPTVSDIKKKLGIEGKKVILSVVNMWGGRKGSEYLVKLASLLSDDEVIVVVGMQPSQMKYLVPEKMIGIQRTNSVQELAMFYSAADVFVIPTLEDNFPTTNIESLACGTPVVTFNTGGSVESVLDAGINITSSDVCETKYGIIVPQGDVYSLRKALKEVILKGKAYYQNNCVEKVRLSYNKNEQYKRYINLYNMVVKK